MKRYNIINNTLGWLCFIVAATTYLLTIEPTASFWDCPEFIAQGAKLEVGHPPGNPIFMLTARFFVTIFGGDITQASVAVNSMSALLSAATILLLFWTITHLVRKIVVRDNATEISIAKTIVIMGAGLCGALCYTWSDTFWFSAVEGEVYAFSSFCSALVFWLILKWENRADEPHSDRYLILIAYVIGVSIAVHLLNLLCIPAIVLVFYYRKYKNTTAKGSLIALGVSVVLVAAILYGLVPGFVKVAQGFELFFVNVCHLNYNTGVLIYAIALIAVFAATIKLLYTSKNKALVKMMVLLVLMLSGLLFITDSKLIWAVLILGMVVYLFGFCNPIPRRIFSIGVISILVIFIGYSSYALLLIRASADTPMNQNAPDNVFSLASYLNREQYGQTPLFYGQVFSEKLNVQSAPDQDGNDVLYIPVDQYGLPQVVAANGITKINRDNKTYCKAVKKSPEQPDEYVLEKTDLEYEYSPDAKMLFTRMHSSDPNHIEGYKQWSGYVNEDIETMRSKVPASVLDKWAERGFVTVAEISPYISNIKTFSGTGRVAGADEIGWTPSMVDNIQYFLNYQLNHMYWRYFMWNFAGRQNDIQGNGEPQFGNWISGIPFIDNARLGDQSLLPEEFTTGNKGHNVFFMLPLLMGLLGLFWQSLFYHKNNPKRGIEQFWVVFFLFFMTGIAIVLYLNQPPGQPRERDYAFAGSFYAFAIWVGMGVPALWKIFSVLAAKIKPQKSPVKGDGKETVEKEASGTAKVVVASLAAVIGLLVPLQMVSQTWDDHDRSHRYTTRDFGENYLNSLEPNAIIFTNGDNDTFPLWYTQEVEGKRTDVRVVNLSYLSTDWYANQLQNPYYDAQAVKMLAKPGDYAYDRLSYTYTDPNSKDRVDALDGLQRFYANPLERLPQTEEPIPLFKTPNLESVVDFEIMCKRFGLNPDTQSADTIYTRYLKNVPMPGLSGRGFGLNTLLSFDIVANSLADNLERPVYFASTVPESYYLGLTPNMQLTGMAYQVTPFNNPAISPVAEKAYENIVSKYRWGGLDDARYNKGLYLDETVRRMVSTVRSSMVQIAEDLINGGELPASEFAVKWAKDNNLPVPKNHYDMARHLLNLLEEKLPADVCGFESQIDSMLATLYAKLYIATGNTADYEHAAALIDQALAKYARYAKWGVALGDDYKIGNLGLPTEYQVRFSFPMFVAYKTLLEGAKKYNADRESYSGVAEILPLVFDSSLRTDVYPGVFFREATADIFNHYAEIAPSAAQYYQRGAALCDVLSVLGINPTEVGNKMAQEYGLTSREIALLSTMK